MPIAVLAVHGALALAAPALARRLGRKTLLVCALAPASAVGWALMSAVDVNLDPVTSVVSWVPSVGLYAQFRLDAFALVMVLLVSGIGTLMFVYAAAYFPQDERKLGGFAAALTAFAGAMFGLVLADNLILLFVFWELTSITSFFLIGTKDRDPAARGAALQALLTTGAGGLALLGGLVLIGQAAGTYTLSGILASPPAGTGVTAGLVLVLLGAFTKSAQVPFHAWLPGAMAAPTPVSAYLHSATMVKAGVYVIARLAPAFALVPVWRPAVIGVGAMTMLLGAYRALRQVDLKLLLAYGTVSQLGFMVVMFGVGTPDATFAGVTLILAHGLFKATLFLVVGVIDVRTGSRDIRELSGLRRAMPLMFAVAVVAGASMAGLPPLVGFIAKEAAFEGLLAGESGAMGTFAVMAVVLGSALTVAYTLRFLFGAFGRDTRATSLRRPATPGLVAPAALLAGLTVVIGVLPFLVDNLLNAAATALDPAWTPHKVSLWHGLNVALGLSVLAVLGGVVAFIQRRRVELWQSGAPALLSAQTAYEATVSGVVRTARRVTGVVQQGSLPTYLLVILTTAIVLPGAALLMAAPPWPVLPLASNALQAAICLLAVVAALASTLVARRFAAVLLLGAVGYSVAALFVLHGAPDLALTQMLVETLSLVIFVLVLRHLPSRFGTRPAPIDRVLRFGVAALVGAGVFVFALMAGAARTGPSVSREYIARAYPEAEGRNIVNVILVDFRALDTLGEITVLLTAALGIASLVVGGRLTRSPATFDGSDHDPVPGHEDSA